ncbi:hypothetical protein UPTC17655_a0029 (plasmid) [Campylobacter lari]|uniref:hypothetical protein n=1 Tax=Campylobacter lari TaxID=201 RepID=UPI00215361E7
MFIDFLTYMLTFLIIHAFMFFCCVCYVAYFKVYIMNFEFSFGHIKDLLVAIAIAFILASCFIIGYQKFILI